MKNYYIFLLFWSLQPLFAQVCTPNNTYLYGGFYPQDSLTSTCQNTDYEETITWVIPKDTLFNNIFTQIDSVQLWNVLNLPNGINYTPSNNHYLGGTKGCILLSGIPNVAGMFDVKAVCQWFYRQNGNALAKIDTISLPSLHIYPELTTQIIAISDPHCGQHDGTAVLYAYGAHPPFTYSWNNGQVGTVATQLAGGIYTVHIQSIIGCTIERSVTLETLDNNISVTFQQENVSCANGNDGQITVFPVGNAPFSYQWSNGATSASLSNLASGLYEVAITDADTCTAVYTASLSSPTEIELNAIVSPDTMLLGLGSINIQATGGTAPYLYSWSNGNTNSYNTGLYAGNYSLWLSDANGCIVSENYNLFSVSILSNVENIAASPIVIYPNPTQGIFFVEMPENATKATFSLYNLAAQKVLIQNIISPKDAISVEKMAKGAYFYELLWENKKAYGKIFIE